MTHEEAAGQNQPNQSPNQPPAQQQGRLPCTITGLGVQTLNKGYNYSFFAGLTRIGLMRWTLQNLSNSPRPSQIESFIRYFELNQDALMSDPMHLTNKLKEWFGEKTGALCDEMFCSYQTFKTDRAIRG